MPARALHFPEVPGPSTPNGIRAMLEGIRRMVQGLEREGLRLDLIAQNVANAQTPGFAGTSAGGRASGFEAWLRREAGAVEATGRGLDVALPEGVYLSVSTPAGTRYARRGDLTLTATGVLTTGDGLPVLDKGGLEIRVTGGSPTVAPDGAVWAGGERVADLGLFHLPAVAETGGTLFTPPPGSAPEPASTALVVGALERSNVEPAREMADLAASVRRAGLLQGFARLQDATLERAISELGRSRG